MTVTIYALRRLHPTFQWYVRTFWHEVRTALLLGAASGLMVGIVVWLWLRATLAAVAIGSSILIAICAACLFGLSIPIFLHAMKLDQKIASGPLTLAIVDICTIIIYFSVAALLL